MNCKNLIIATVLILLVYSCEKQESSANADWIPTKLQNLLDINSDQTAHTRGRLYALNDSCVFFFGRFGSPTLPYIFRISLNSEDVVDLSSQVNPYTIDISFYSDSEGYLLRGYGTSNPSLLFTNDGGYNWIDSNLSVPAAADKIHFQGLDSGIAITYGHKYYVLCTTDGGKNWQQSTDPNFFGEYSLRKFTTLRNNPRKCFLSLYGQKILYSIDGGFTWKLHSNHNLNENSMYFLSQNEGYISTMKGIYGINQIGSQFELLLSFEGIVDKIEANDKSDLFYLSAYIIYHIQDDFRQTRKMTLEDPFPDEGSDGAILDFIISEKTGLLVDTKGTIYRRAIL